VHVRSDGSGLTEVLRWPRLRQGQDKSNDRCCVADVEHGRLKLLRNTVTIRYPKIFGILFNARNYALFFNTGYYVMHVILDVL
jgi:hypothetical protein